MGFSERERERERETERDSVYNCYCSVPLFITSHATKSSVYEACGLARMWTPAGHKVGMGVGSGVGFRAAAKSKTTFLEQCEKGKNWRQVGTNKKIGWQKVQVRALQMHFKPGVVLGASYRAGAYAIALQQAGGKHSFYSEPDFL